MENINYQFKTNIDCSSCVAIVSTFLNDARGIAHWEVDTTNSAKILTVVPDGINPQGVIAAVEKAGFKIESIM